VQTSKLENLIKKLFTSFGFSSQALNVAADGFNSIAITQGLDNKTAQIVKNAFLALVDKSQELGKKGDSEMEEKIINISHLMINVIQTNAHLANITASEVNSDICDLFADKKADSIQGYIDRNNTTFEYLIKSINDILSALVDIKVLNLKALGEESSTIAEKLACTVSGQSDHYERLVLLSDLLEQASTQEEFLSFQKLQVKDKE